LLDSCRDGEYFDDFMLIGILINDDEEENSVIKGTDSDKSAMV
jgi:hypothetical protein